MAELHVPQVWKVVVPSKIFPRLNFLQNRVKNCLGSFRHKFEGEKEVSPIYQCLLQTTQSPTVFVFSGHLLDRSSVIDMLKLPDQMYNDLDISKKALSEFENSFGEVKFSESPYVFLACIEGKHDDKRYADGRRKLKLSAATQCLMERLKSCIPFEETGNMLYAIELDFESGMMTDLEALNQIEELMTHYDYHDFNKQGNVILGNKLFLTSEVELPARVSRVLEEKVKNTVTEFTEKMDTEIKSFKYAVSMIKDGNFKSDVVKNVLENISEHVKTWITKHACSEDVPHVASSLALLINSTLTDSSMDLLLSHSFDILLHKNEIYNIAEFLTNATDLENEFEHMMLVQKLDVRDLQQQPINGDLKEGILERTLESFDKRWNNAILPYEEKTSTLSKLKGSMEDVLEKANLRLKEKIPHCLQVQAARMKEVKCLAIVDCKLDIFVSKECYENEKKSDKVKCEFSKISIPSYVRGIQIHKSEKDLELYSLLPGSHIGFPNPKYAGGVRFRHGTVGTKATEANEIKYVITCAHVAEPGQFMYTRSGDYVGEATRESSVSLSDEAFGNLLDFAAVKTELHVDFAGFEPKGEPAVIEVFDGDFETLEKRDMFLFGATSGGPLWVKYFTNVSINRDQYQAGARRSTLRIPTQTMRGLDVVEAVTDEEPQPGDSGSLVCYHDTVTNKIYGVFLLVGNYMDKFACCRLCEGLDILADRGFTLQV